MALGLIGRTLRRLKRPAASDLPVPPEMDEARALSMLLDSDRLRDQGKLDDALRLVEDVAKTIHHSAATLTRLGVLYYLSGRFHDAKSSFDAALKLDNEDGLALRYLAATLASQGDYKLAIATAERSIAIGAPNAQTHNFLGAIHMRQGTFEEAGTHFHRALEIDPTDLAPLENLEVLRARFGGARIGNEEHRHTEEIRARLIAELSGKLDAGVISAQEGDQLATLTNNRRETFALAMKIAGLFQDAPDLTASFATTLAVVRQNAGQLSEALALRERAFLLAPDGKEVQNGLGWILIAEGGKRWHEGWRLFSDSARALNPRNYPTEVPDWRGEDLRGQKLFVYAEQGVGDAILALRLVSILGQRGVSVVLWVPTAFAGLAKSIPGYAEFHTSEQRPDARVLGCTYACSLFGIIAALNLSAADVRTSPLLAVPAETKSLWKARLAGLPGRRVALTSVGNPGRIDDWLRTVPVEFLRPLAGIMDVSWVNLSVDQRDATQAVIEEFKMFDAAREITDFVDTAAVLDAVDAVVAIDCAAAHVAGSLGKPLFVFKPTVVDWRWQVGDDPAPWWPTSRLYAADAPGQWTNASERLAKDLAEHLQTLPS
jgi:tetratricopeptide (TPR) repeat protein